MGYKLFIITNQSGIGRGYYSIADFDKLTSWMLEEFKIKNIDIEKVFYCPHTPQDNCECRKPKIGMIKDAMKMVDIDLENSWLVGDKTSDIECAINANINNTIQVQSGHSFDRTLSKAKYIIESIKDIADIIKK